MEYVKEGLGKELGKGQSKSHLGCVRRALAPTKPEWMEAHSDIWLSRHVPGDDIVSMSVSADTIK